MEPVNGVKIITEHCGKCLCRTCKRWDFVRREQGHVRCPYDRRPCYACDRKAYVEDCVFRE